MDAEKSNTRNWCNLIKASSKEMEHFITSGNHITEKFLAEKANGTPTANKDKYNMLYSTTETITPNLYGQQPKPRVVLRHKDRKNVSAKGAQILLAANIDYVMAEFNFDEVMEGAVQDLLLPGIGNAWVGYDPEIADATNDNGDPIFDDETKEPMQELKSECIALDYVHWQDIRYSSGRTWADIWWIARRVRLTKPDIEKRWGTKVGDFTFEDVRDDAASYDDTKIAENVVEIWEIWDKKERKVIWYCEKYGIDKGIIDSKDDPLKLKKFFPCPRPLRAVTTTKKFLPRPLFSQYQTQSDYIDTLTSRIRMLTDAIKVRGVYNGAMSELKQVLENTGGNLMVGIENWASFTSEGKISDLIQWMPIDMIVRVLAELVRSREIAKAEVYEITGFSDILRGQSKASETLGAQNIKTNWAAARLKRMQKEVQRFARDLIAITGEIIAEHFEFSTILENAGLEVPEGVELLKDSVDPVDQQKYVAFDALKKAYELMKKEKTRCVNIGIETDSTILANEEQERSDRTAFLAAIGAFLQQAMSAAEQFPEMRELLAAIMMFTVRTFPSSMPIQDAFERMEAKMLEDPPKVGGQQQQPPPPDPAMLAQQALTLEAAKHENKMLENRANQDHQERLAKIASEERIELARLANELAMAKIALETKKLNVAKTNDDNVDTGGNDGA